MKSMSDHYQKPHTLNDCKLTSFNKHEYLSISREKPLPGTFKRYKKRESQHKNIVKIE